MDACSHSRVQIYYAESINSNCKFEAVPCKSYDEFKKGKCSCNPETGCPKMGFWSENDKNKEERFYLDTNESKPYCKN